MSDQSNGSGNGALYFIDGALVAGAVAFGIYYITQGGGQSSPDEVSISVSDDGIEIDGN